VILHVLTTFLFDVFVGLTTVVQDEWGIMDELNVGSNVPMVLRMPFVKPLLAQFVDARTDAQVGLDSAVKPLHMTTETETVQEFESETADARANGSEYYKQKHSRRYYKKVDDAKILLQDARTVAGGGDADGPRSSAEPTRVNYEGTKANHSIQSAGSNAQYVLLKLSKSGAGGAPELDVMPVGEWYSFRKVSTQEANISLEDIDYSFDQLQTNKKLANKKYRGISKVLEMSSSSGAGAGNTGTDKPKPPGRGRFTLMSGAGDALGADDPFGDAATKALTKKAKNKKDTGAVNPMLEEKKETHMDNWEETQYGDWGVDEEAAEQFDEGVSDDDASFIAEEQAEAEGQEAYTGGKIADDDLFGSDDEDTSSDESSDEEADKPDALIDSGKELRLVGHGVSGSAADSGSGPLTAASEAMGRAGGSIMNTKGGGKRKAGDMEVSRSDAGSDSGSDSMRGKRTRPDSPGSVASGTAGATTSGKSGSKAIADEFLMSDVTVAAFVVSQPGGRTTFRNMGMAFKKHIKLLNKKVKGSGDSKFLGIVTRMLAKMEDPALGPVYVLKK
jgi:hypothetical protein